jgi:hypothetical protein
MKASTPPDQRDTAEKKLRKWFIILALALAGVSGLHFVDHILRGSLVVTHHLDSNWDHSGWPFEPSVTPFTFSFFGVFFILLGGIYFTYKKRAWAGYWLVSSLVLGALVTFIHFFPGSRTEFPSIIYYTYIDAHYSSVASILALFDLFGILVLIVALICLAIKARRISGRW